MLTVFDPEDKQVYMIRPHAIYSLRGAARHYGRPTLQII